MVPQNVTERHYRRGVKPEGRSNRLCDDLVTATQVNDVITARLEHEGSPLEVRAIFLVGCDGSHGTVRHLLDLPFTGGEYRHHGLHREPGEIADADFGYVGGAPGKVNLYVGKTAVKFNIPEDEAVERLQDLIREHGKWVEPSAEPASVPG